MRLPYRASAAAAVVDELGAVERREQRLDELVAGDRRRRADRFARDLIVLVANQRGEQIEKRVGHERDQARRLRAFARAIRTRRAHHGLEERPGRVEVLRGPGRGQKRRHPGADREILEIAQLLDLRQRIDVHLPRQIEERLGANPEVGVLEHLDGAGAAISRSPAARRSDSARRRISASGCRSSTRSAGCQLLVCCTSSSPSA